MRVQGREPLLAAAAVGLAGTLFFLGLYLGLTSGKEEAAGSAAYAAVVAGLFTLGMLIGIPVVDRAGRRRAVPGDVPEDGHR